MEVNQTQPFLSSSGFLSKIFYYLRFEEILFLVFLFILLFFLFQEGNLQIIWNADRLAHAFAVGSIFAMFVKINLVLFRNSRINWEELTHSIKDAGKQIRDFLGVFMLWSMYSSMESLLQGRELKDDLLIAVDRWIFGGVDPVVWLERCISPWLTNFLSFCYLILFIYIPALVIALVWKNNRRGLRELMISLVLSAFFGYFGYWLVPAIGPKLTQNHLFTIDLWKNPEARISKKATFYLIDLNRIKKDCFPSMHTCLAVLCLFFSFRWTRKMFWWFLPFIIGLVFSTVYLRYHYVIDSIAGFSLALACFYAADPLLRMQMRLGNLCEKDL